MRPITLNLTMGDPPTREELETAISSMKNGKMGGQSWVLPEMVKAAGSHHDFVDYSSDC